jgi:hypothetical protein
MFGRDLVPISPDIDVGGFAIPTTRPLSFITGFGREPSDGTVFRRTASSLNIEDASKLTFVKYCTRGSGAIVMLL